MRTILSIGAALFFWGAASTASAQVQASPTPENTGPNSNIVRWAEGKYIYRTADGKRERAWERFHLNTHPDGSRTIIMWHDLYARNNQFTVVVRVAENYRPIQAYLSYWSPNGYKGSNLINIMGDKLTAITNGPQGLITQSISVPENVSIGTHPVAADGWHSWYEDKNAKGMQKGTLYSIEATADNSKPPLGTSIPFEFERLGKEKITVPAGTFDVIKYKLGEGGSEAWVMEQDRLMVRVLNGARGFEYLLTEFKAGNNAKK
ncbi:MAG: hypothetical protein EXR11_02900 [Rhodospirillaceae bacterium]|nr:hypothetical protein [Rhodospirillaceae bacterium]